MSIKRIKNFNQIQNILKSKYVVFDLETTGFNPQREDIIEIGAILYDNGIEINSFQTLIQLDLQSKISTTAKAVNKIDETMLANQKTIKEVLNEFKKFIKNHVLIAHNVNFDFNFLTAKFKRHYDIEVTNWCIDSIDIFKYKLDIPSYKLGNIANHLGISYKDSHRALEDVKITHKCILEVK